MADIQNSIDETKFQPTFQLETVRRIFGYRKVYVYVANLTDSSLFLPYLGYWGYRLPALSDKTTPIRKFIRTHKTYKVRKAHYQQLLNDTKTRDAQNNPVVPRIAWGLTRKEVEDAIAEALRVKALNSTEANDSSEENPGT